MKSPKRFRPSHTFTALDMETSGLRWDIDRVLIVDLATFVAGKYREGKTFWIHPPFELSRPLLKFIRRKKGDFIHARLLHEVSGGIRKALGAHPLVFYHAEPDLKLIESEFGVSRKSFKWPPVDILPMAREVMPDLSNYRLETLRKAAVISQRSWPEQILKARLIGELAIRLSMQKAVLV